MQRNRDLLLMWKSLANPSRRRRCDSPRMAESIGVFFSMGFNRLRCGTQLSKLIAPGVKTPSNRGMATVLRVR